MERLARWFEELGLVEHFDAFRENDIDFDILPHLTDDDLKELGLSIGHRRRLLVAISALSEQRQPSEIAPNQLRNEAAVQMDSRDAEHRQVSVMFCDLVGSTELSTRLNPEELSDVMRAYRDASSAPIQRYGGFVARFIGDGILAYFGYPQAHENDAERAMRGGLEVIDAVRYLKPDFDRETELSLAVRVGIATGHVLVGDIIGETQTEANAIVGEAPNVAARLQSFAKPNTLVIDSQTRRLAGEHFEYQELGGIDLKGIEEPVRVCQVLAIRQVASRFADRNGSLTQLVGRVEEIEILYRRWQAARNGAGRVVLLCGEAGIGKSRVAEALRERLEHEGSEQPLHLYFQCSPYYVNSPLHPVINQLERMAGIRQSDTSDEKLSKLEATFDDGIGEQEYTLALFADLLSIPAVGRYRSLDLSARQKRDRTMSALGVWFESTCARQPVLLTFEDAHWIDPTSQVVLDDLISRARRNRALIIITYRPEFSAPWVGQPHVTALTLNRLDEREAEQLAHAVAGDKSLPQELLDEILRKTDGVPLFIEECAKGVISSGYLESDNGGYEVSAPLSSLGIPSSIHSSLMSRVDQLGPAKVVAQVGSAIGREFSSKLLSRVACLSEEELAESLKQLANSELVFEHGLPPDTTYEFKHALIQEAAYESLRKQTREKLHLKIAQALEAQDDDLPEADPALLAFHFWRAESARAALENWERAADRAFDHSALVEAEGHLRNALNALTRLDDSEERSRRELALSMQLGTVLRATHGYSAPEIEDLYVKMSNICQELGLEAEWSSAEWALMQIYLVQGKLQNAKNIANGLFRHAKGREDDQLRMDAHLALGMANIHLGEFVEAEANLKASAGLYRRDRDKPRLLTHGQDAGVFAQGYLYWCQWFLGKAEDSRRGIAETVSLAREISHQFSLVSALLFAANIHQCLRDFEAVKTLTKEIITEASDGGYEYYEAIAAIHQGWARALDDGDEGGISQMLEGLETHHRLGTVHRQRGLLVELAEAYWKFDRKSQALAALDRAWGKGGSRSWDVEVHRATGEILAQGSRTEQAAAETAFQTGLRTAREQGATALELRIAASYAKFLLEQKREPEAAEIIKPCLAKFNKGSEVADLRNAEALADQISAKLGPPAS